MDWNLQPSVHVIGTCCYQCMSVNLMRVLHVSLSTNCCFLRSCSGAINACGLDLQLSLHEVEYDAFSACGVVNLLLVSILLSGAVTRHQCM